RAKFHFKPFRIQL
ncbi:hypothetical protein D047_1778B, partial [Vibrio parahaemolyticus VPTS-2010_2]